MLLTHYTAGNRKLVGVSFGFLFDTAQAEVTDFHAVAITQKNIVRFDITTVSYTHLTLPTIYSV